MAIPTPHIEAAELGIIAETVLMPGDPLRAKFIADTFLSDVVLFNQVRGMLGYTGHYKGTKVSVMGSGMGNASMGIYSDELYAFYQVENIIRIGSAGSYTKELELYDIVLAQDSWSESSYAQTQSGATAAIMQPSAQLNGKILAAATRLGTPLRPARIHTSDVFYRQNFAEYQQIQATHGCSCVEMEAFALFANAQVLNKHAACVLTISDSLVTHAATSSSERQVAFTKMMELVLETLHP